VSGQFKESPLLSSSRSASLYSPPGASPAAASSTQRCCCCCCSTQPLGFPSHHLPVTQSDDITAQPPPPQANHKSLSRVGHPCASLLVSRSQTAPTPRQTWRPSTNRARPVEGHTPPPSSTGTPSPYPRHAHLAPPPPPAPLWGAGRTFLGRADTSIASTNSCS